MRERTAPLEDLFASDDGAASDRLRAHLKAVHDDAAGFTESCAWACRDGRGRNSYAWIVDAASPPPGGRVLDLACGSGVLLELCRTHYGSDVALTGVDMSAAELALAATRVAGAGVTLHEGLAQSIAFARDAEFDVVLCHWALTLMEPLAPVLDEVARVLRPGGVFAAIVDGPAEAAAGYGEICDLIDSHVKAAEPGYMALGDPRARDGAALARLAADAFPGADVTIKTEVFALEGEPDTLAREIAGFFYSSFVLSPDQCAVMLDELAGFLGARPVARYEMPVNRLRVARA